MNGNENLTPTKGHNFVEIKWYFPIYNPELLLSSINAYAMFHEKS